MKLCQHIISGNHNWLAQKEKWPLAAAEKVYDRVRGAAAGCLNLGLMTWVKGETCEGFCWCLAMDFKVKALNIHINLCLPSMKWLTAIHHSHRHTSTHPSLAPVVCGVATEGRENNEKNELGQVRKIWANRTKSRKKVIGMQWRRLQKK